MTVPVPGTPVDVVAGPDAASVSVVTHEPSAVLALDTATNRVTVSVELDDALVPEQAVTAPNGVVYLSDPASSVVTFVDLPNSRTGRIPLAGRVRGLALSGDGHRLYATLEHPASLVSVDLTGAASPTELPEPLPDAPDSVAVTADGQEVLVALPRRAQVVLLTPPGPE
jgi:DNA-binding beta-propeller fold protein YncE